MDRNKGVAALTRGNKEEAVAELEAQIRVNPRYNEPYLLLERILRVSGKSEPALDVIRKLFNSGMSMKDKCDVIASGPQNAYEAQDPKLIELVRSKCGK